MDLESLINVFNTSNLQNVDADTALENARLIFDCFRHHIDPSKLDKYLELIFLEGEGLSAFLLRQLAVKKYDKSKEQLLLLLKFLLSTSSTSGHWRNQVFPFCITIKKVANLYWRNSSEFSKHQQIALDCLVLIFETYENEVDEQTFELPSLYLDLLPASERSTLQPTVQGKILHVLGLIAGITREGFMTNQHFRQLYHHIISMIAKEVEGKGAKLEVSILHGGLKAMNTILKYFGQTLSKESDDWNQFQRNLAQIVDPKCSIANDGSTTHQLKRREFQRVGLEVVANNGNLFGNELFQRFERWYCDLMTWSKSNNPSDSLIGKKAMYTYLQSVIEFAHKEQKNLDPNAIESFVNFFVAKFQEILGSKNPTRSESLVAIKGVGLLSPFASSTHKLSIMFEEIMESINRIVFELSNPVTDKYTGSLSMVPTYLESVSNLITHGVMQQSSDQQANSKFLSHLNSIEKLALQLISHYPELSEYGRNTAHKCILKIVSSLQLKYSADCVPFVDRVFKAALSQAIASPTSAELDIIYESWKSNNETEAKGGKKSFGNKVGLKGVSSYTPFWINLTNCNADNTESEVRALLYDRIILWTLSTIEKLDLSVSVNSSDHENEEQGSGDIFSRLKAATLKDFQLFINLVEFLQSYFVNTDQSLFEIWANEFITKIVEYIQQHPLISGFYKILASAFEVARTVDYFKNIAIERQPLFDRCNMFMKSLTTKIGEFRDDLLISVLDLWLSAPDELLIQNVGSWSSTLKTTFAMGRVCFRLADTSVDALQRWLANSDIPREVMEEIAGNLLPIWQSYFTSEGFTAKALRSPTNVRLKHKKDDLKVSKLADVNDVTLRKIQLKLLNLIGSFAHLIDVENYVSIDYSLEKEQDTLKYSITVQDLSPDMYFDALIPRVLILCENSADRQIRTAACEFLHTIILYFLGFSIRGTTTQAIGLFNKMFRTTMKLSGDFDFLIRQLFNPLASQCIHWFTRQSNGYSEAVLQIIVDGLVQVDDAQLRDFSADSLSEYFKWALKNNNKELSKEVLNFIVALSTHADEQYRLGAAIGFNGIYKTYREDMDLWNGYTILLLTSFINCLALSQNSEDESVLIKTSILSISHLERILVRKKDNFNNKIKGRKKPPGFTSEIVCLGDLTDWLLVQIGKPHRICRGESSRLLKILGPLVRGCGSLQNCLSSTLTKAEKIIQIAEQSKKDISLDSCEGLLMFLDSASEFYSFVFQHGNPENPDYSILANENSVFLDSLQKMLTLSCDNIDKRLWRAATRICLRFPDFGRLVPAELKFQFIRFSMFSSESSNNQEELRIFMAIWSGLELNEDSVAYIRGKIDGAIKSEQTASPRTIQNLQWLRIAAESLFLQKVIGSDMKVQMLAKDVWIVLNKKLFLIGDSGQIETNFIPSMNGIKELEEQLRLCLALGFSSDIITDAAFDSTVVEVKSNLLQKTTKGEVFQKYLRRTMLYCGKTLNFVGLTYTVKIEKIGSFIDEIILSTKGDKTFKKQFGAKFFESVVDIWTPLSVNCDPFTVARILSGLAALDIDKCRNSAALSDWWCGKEVMGASHLNLNEKAEFIGFLSLFALSKQPNIVNNVLTAVETTVVHHMRLDISWTEQKKSLSNFVQQLVSVYEKLPMNLKLVQILAICVAKISAISAIAGDSEDSAGFLLKNVTDRLQSTIHTLKQDNQVVEVAKCLFETIMKYEDCRKNLTVSKHCLLPVIYASNVSALKLFYKEKISSLMDAISENLSSPSIELWNSQIVVYNLLALIPQLCGASFITELDNEFLLVQQRQGLPEKERKSILKILSSDFLRIKQALPHPESDPLKRGVLMQRNSAAYKAVSSNLVAAEDKVSVKLLEGMLIHENRPKVCLWEKLIDCSKSAKEHFPILLAENENANQNAENQVPDEESSFNSHINQSIKTRINLAQSSLVTDAGTYDFTDAVTVSDSTFYQRIFGPVGNRKKTQRRNASPQSLHLSFTSSAFSDECVEGLVKTIKKLSSMLKTDQTTQSKWVEYLKDVLEGSHHENIKIFIVLGFLNCQKDVKLRAKTLIDPVLGFILTDAWKEPFNYLVKDILVMLLGWNEVAIPSELLKRRAVRYIIENISAQDKSYNRNDVLEYNLKLLDAIINFWKIGTGDLPTELVLQLLRVENTKVGLSVCNHILQAGKLPSPDPFGLLREFSALLTKEKESKAIYSVAARNLGLLMKYISADNHPDTEKAAQYLAKKIESQRARLLAFVNILNSVQQHWPNVTTYFKETMMELLATTAVHTETINLLPTCLNIELMHVQPNDARTIAMNFISNLEGRGLFLSPCTISAEAEAGVSILEALVKVAYQGDVETLMNIVDWLKVLQEDGENVQLRTRYFRSICKIYSKIKSSTLPNHFDIQKKILEIFIVLSRDDNIEIKEVVNEFWPIALKDMKPIDLVMKFIELIGDKPDSLEIILTGILHQFSCAPDFQKTIFDKPLEDCLFETYSLDTSWKRQASFLPLFAESLSSQPFSKIPTAIQATLIRQRHNVSEFGVNLLRATLSLRKQQFSPTLEMDNDSQSSEVLMEVDYPFFPVSSYNAYEHEGELGEPDAFSDLRRHFYHRPAGNEFFAARQSNRNATELRSKLEKMNAKKNVKLTRSYRVGELPDILMKHSDLLNTIINLAKLDMEIGRMIIVQLITSMLEKEEGRKVEASSTFETLLKNHRSVNSFLAATILDVSIRNGLWISPELITNVCVDHDLYELGITMLEKHIMQPDDTKSDQPTTKRPRMESVAEAESTEVSAFLKLAELYQDLEEFDVLKNLFLLASSKCDGAVQDYQDASCALSLESVGKLDEALDKYKDLFHELNGNSMKYNSSYESFVENAFLTCLSKLSEWKQLVDEGVKLHEKRQLRHDPLIGQTSQLIIEAALMQTLEEADDSSLSKLETSKLWNDIENFQCHTERALLLLCSDVQNAYKSLILLETAWNNSVSSVSNIQRLSLHHRRQLILRLQLSGTLEDVLEWYKRLDSRNVESKTLELAHKIEKLYGNNMSSLGNSDALVSARSYFLKKFMDDELVTETDGLVDKLNLLNFKQHLWVLSLGMRDKNFVVANKYLAKSKTLGDDVTRHNFVEWRKLYITYLATFYHVTPIDEWLKMWSSAWKKIANGSPTQSIEKNDVVHMRGQLLSSILKATKNQENLLQSSSRKALTTAFGVSQTTSIKDAVEKGCRKLFDFIHNSGYNECSVMMTDSSLQVYYLIESLIEKFPDQYSSDDRILNLMLRCLLRSMEMDNTSGILLFPRLLGLLEQFNNVHPTFIQHFKTVPLWKFLPWLDQIVTAHQCNNELRPILVPIVQAITQKYPNALQFQYEHLLPRNSSWEFRDMYLKSLKALVLPTILHKDVLEELNINTRRNNYSAILASLSSLRNTFQEICDNDSIYGSLHTEFANDMLNVINIHLEQFDDEYSGVNKNSQEQTDTFKTLRGQIKSLIDSYNNKVLPRRDNEIQKTKVIGLKELTPWLASFHHSHRSLQLEIPGLYDKLSKLNVELHPNIVSFNPTVTIYSSLTNPIRLTMLGNNGKRINFLAKYGDDLRQDRRIQQLLGIANNFFKEDSKTRQKKINIISYSVLPISESFGLIEWVDKTVDLKSFILKNKTLRRERDEAAYSHTKWIEETSGLNCKTTPEFAIYCASAKNTKRADAERHFTSLTSKTSVTLLRDNLQERSRSFEQFFKVRQNILRSYSTMCVVHWLLGIGDRHLENCLFSLETGEIVGIDFGRAFGTSNTLQLIPEMVPFRLTPHWSYLMLPYGHKGLFKETMLTAFRCLIESSDIILFIISAYVNERSVNWTKKRKKLDIEVMEPDKMDWKPLQIIRRKLECQNPVTILLEEIQLNLQRNIVPVYCDVVKDGRESMVETANTMSQEEVVDSLLDLATDKNILCRIYSGWSSWI